MTEVSIPFYIEGGEYGTISLKVTDSYSSVLKEEDIVVCLKNNVDIKGVERDLKRLCEIRIND